MAILRLARSEEGGSDDNDNSPRAESLVDIKKLKSKSLASYVDLAKKAQHEQKEKLKRLERKQAEMREKEKRLKRAQERAEIEKKQVAAVLGAKITSTQTEAAKAAATEALLQSTSAVAQAGSGVGVKIGNVVRSYMHIFSVLIIILGIAEAGVADQAKKDLTKWKDEKVLDKKMTDVAGQARIDDGQNALTIAAVISSVGSILLGLIGGALWFYGKETDDEKLKRELLKKPPPDKSNEGLLFLLAFAAINTIGMIYLAANIAQEDYLKDPLFDNTNINAYYIMTAIFGPLLLLIGGAGFLLKGKDEAQIKKAEYEAKKKQLLAQMQAQKK